MSSPIELRLFRPADLRDCLRIWRRAAERAHPFLWTSDLDAEEEVIRAALQGQVDVTVASEQNVVVGFIAVSAETIAGLFVDPTLQGQGIGAALVREALARSGASAVEVYAENLRSIGFYKRMGFRELRRRPTDDLGRLHELIVLERAEDPEMLSGSGRLVLRAARQGDVAAITEVLRRAWLDAHAQIVPFEIIRAWAAEDWNARHAARHWPSMTVAERGAVIGMVQTDGPLVAELFVHPSAHRSGVGSALLSHAVLRIKDEGHGCARVQLLEQSERAFRFYRSQGWRETGEVEEKLVAGVLTRLHAMALPLCRDVRASQL